jgi:hypothetical protein
MKRIKSPAIILGLLKQIKGLVGSLRSNLKVVNLESGIRNIESHSKGWYGNTYSSTGVEIELTCQPLDNNQLTMVNGQLNEVIIEDLESTISNLKSLLNGESKSFTSEPI